MKRVMTVLVCLASLAHATKVQEILVAANGKRIEGNATISWPTFTGTDGTVVPQGSINLTIRQGVISVDLKPYSAYRVRYTLAGQEPFTETWNVPQSSSVLSVKQVRVLDPTDPGTGGPGPVSSTTAYLAPFDVDEYETGTVSVVNGSSTVTGIGTTWTSTMNGMMFMTGRCQYAYRFTYVSPTSGTLEAPWGCDGSETAPASVRGSVAGPFVVTASTDVRFKVGEQAVTATLAGPASQNATAVNSTAPVIVYAPGHPFQTGDYVKMDGVQVAGSGNFADGTQWTITVIDGDTFSPNTSVAAKAPIGATATRVQTVQRDVIAASTEDGPPVKLTVPGHGFSTGDTILVSGVDLADSNDLYRQTWTITVVDADSFLLNEAVSYGTVWGNAFAAKTTTVVHPVTSVTNTITPVTLTVPGHGFSTGQSVKVSMQVGDITNGYRAYATWPVTVLDADTFTLDGSFAVSGTLTGTAQAASVMYSAAQVVSIINAAITALGVPAVAQESAGKVDLVSTLPVGTTSSLTVLVGSTLLGWEAGTRVGGVGQEYTLVRPIVIPGVTHQLATNQLTVTCYIGTDTWTELRDKAAVTINPSSYDINVLLWGAQSGNCIVQK